MRYAVAAALLSALSFTIQSADAQQRKSTTNHAAVVTPFVDGQTVGLAHVDLSQLKVGPLFDETADFIESGQVIGPLPQSREAIDEFKKNLAKWLEMIELAGIRHVYLLMTLEDLPNKQPAVIVPLPEDSAQQGMAEFLLAGFGEKVHKLAGALVACDDEQWTRLSGVQPVDRPEMAAAFQAVGDSTAQLLILPNADARRVVEELLPKLPDQVGGAPSTVLTRGAQWVAVGVKAPPGLSIEFVVQSSDEPAAAALRDLWGTALRFAAADKALRELAPTIDQAAELLTPRLDGDRLSLRLENEGIAALSAALKPPANVVRRITGGRKSINNLKMMALAMHVHHDAHKRFPAAASYDADGKPLLSWRVHILPYVDQLALYEKFRLDEPWDSDHNRELIERMPDIYRSPASRLDDSGRTNYLLPTGEHALFSGREGPRFKDIIDGTSNTIMIVEADDDQAVEWTKPDDLTIDPESPARGLGGLYEDGFYAAYCDGSVRRLPDTIAADTLRALFTRNGRESVPPLP